MAVRIAETRRSGVYQRHIRVLRRRVPAASVPATYTIARVAVVKRIIDATRDFTDGPGSLLSDLKCSSETLKNRSPGGYAGRDTLQGEKLHV